MCLQLMPLGSVITQQGARRRAIPALGLFCGKFCVAGLFGSMLSLRESGTRSPIGC